MTKEQKATLAVSIPGALLAGGAIVLWLFSAAFVPQKTYSKDRAQTAAQIDSLRYMRVEITALRSDIDQLKRIGCVPLTPEQKQIAGCK